MTISTNQTKWAFIGVRIWNAYLIRATVSLCLPLEVAGLIFFNRPAVQALFKNQQSAISNLKS